MVNIIAPYSITNNNIYSYSEIKYLSGYLKKYGLEVRETLLDVEALGLLDNSWLEKDTIFILQFIDKEVLRWLELCNRIFLGKKILYGVSAQVYYAGISESFTFDLIVSSNSYETIFEELTGKEPRELPHTIKEIQYPDYTVEGIINLPYVPILSSRGCKRNCNFCAISCANKYTRIYIYRSAEDIFEELKVYYNQWNKKRFYFVDSCFVFDEEQSHLRIKKLVQLLQNSNMRIKFSIETRADCVHKELFADLKRVGLSSVLIGIENLNPNVLKRYNKQLSLEQIVDAVNILKDLNIHIDLSMILFDPFTSKEELLDNINGILKYQLYNHLELSSVFRRLVIIPNNKLENTRLINRLPCTSDLPQWYNDSINYRISYESIQFLSEAIDIFYRSWLIDVKQCVAKAKDIIKAKEIRTKKKMIFFMCIKEILERDNTFNTVEEYVQELYELEKKISILEKESYDE